MKKILLLLLTAIVVVSCSTKVKKPEARSKFLKGFSTYYNTLFNAKDALNSEFTERDKAHKDNFYAPYIPILTYEEQPLGSDLGQSAAFAENSMKMAEVNRPQTNGRTGPGMPSNGPGMPGNMPQDANNPEAAKGATVLEIAEAKAGRPARIIIKINSLSDKESIKKIYEASSAGVQVDLIVRGIFCAVNQKKFIKPFHAISIVDEFLEHARVFYFYAAGKELTYISSADLMTRNLDHRVEAAVKIHSKKLKHELLEMLEIQLRDNVKARYLNNKQTNEYVHNDEPICRSQIVIHNYLKSKAEEQEIIQETLNQ